MLIQVLKKKNLGRLLLLVVSGVLAEGACSWAADAPDMWGAARSGNARLTAMLLDAGINPDAQDRFGMGPLHYATSFGHDDVVAVLLERGADPNKETASRNAINVPSTPLSFAAALGHVSTLRLLISCGAKVNLKGKNGRTALHFAALHDSLDAISFLIAKGAEVDSLDNNGLSPSDVATRAGNEEALAVLLIHGAAVNGKPNDATGETLLNEAVIAGNLLMVKYLLRLGANISVPDKQGLTPLDNAVRRKQAGMALLLLNAETSQDLSGSYPMLMQAAIRKGEPDVVHKLLNKGAPSNLQLPSGSMAIVEAASCGSVEIVKDLLSFEANPNAVGPDGSQALQIAALKGFDDIVTTLLDHGASVDATDANSGATALYSASTFGNSLAAHILLTRGADPNICSKEGRTPYQSALDNGYSNIAAEITAHGGRKGCRN